jgi:hypothetical protein
MEVLLAEQANDVKTQEASDAGKKVSPASAFLRLVNFVSPASAFPH